MDKKSVGRKTRAQSRSPARSKSASKAKSPARKSPVKKSPARKKSPGRTKSPGRPRLSPSRKSSPAKKSPKPKASPVRKKSPVREIPPIRKISPIRQSSLPPSVELTNDRDLRSSPFVRLEREDEKKYKSTPKAVETLKNEGHGGEIEVLFIDDDVRYKTSPSNVKFGGKINVGDVRKVKWEDGNYYDAQILSSMEIIRDRSISLPKASTSQMSSRVYSEESTLIRRSSRLRRSEELDKITNVMNAEAGKILKANNVPLPPQYERRFGEKSVREFGSWPGALFTILLMPALALALQMSCTKSKCAGLVAPSYNWRVYFDLHIAGYYLGYLLWHAVLSSLPIGRKASYGHVQARLSGFYNALLTLSALGGLYYFGFNVTAVLGKSVALLTTAILTGLLLAITLFVKGGRVSKGRNLNADGNKIYDFFIGREILPTVGPLSIKAMLTRMEFTGIMLLDSLYLLKYMETHAAGVYSPTLLFIVAAHFIYALDTLWFEEKFMSSFEAQYEGVGYMSAMAAATWPFLLTLITRYALYSNYEAPTYLLAICGSFFALGYFLYRASNSQKAEFRRNPQHSVFAKYETISTFHGKKLLCSGWWGIVRHPNYLGDMIMMWSLAAVCGLSHWVPYVFPALHAAVLIHRTFRVNARCKSLYGASWDRYTQIVKYRLVPRIF